MIIGKGFMQMFTVGGVGSGGFSHSLDVHADIHTPIHNTDYGKQSEARDQSSDGRTTTHFDRDQTMHVYNDGCELASNGDNSSGASSGDSSPYDNNV